MGGAASTRTGRLAMMTDEENDAAKAVLEALDKLTQQAIEAEEHVKRLDKLKKVLDCAPKLQEKSRRKSKEFQDEMKALLEPALEKAFGQFDLDGNGTLDKSELAQAYKAAGRNVSEAALEKSIKLLDKNGDGLITLEEFKEIAVKASLMEAGK